MEANNQNIFVLTSDNFSGRTSYLQSLSKVDGKTIQNGKYNYIGEIPSNFISGLMPTVQDELSLHSSISSPATLNSIESLIRYFSFFKYYSRSPFNLSGGEQAILTILSSLLLEPERLAIDTTLEQLHESWRECLLEAIKNSFLNTSVYISDNRYKQYTTPFNAIRITAANNSNNYNYQFAQPKDDLEVKQGNSCIISLKDVSFSYSKECPILNNINVKLIPGKVYHLKGNNGVGKSTLAKILAGVLKPKKGYIEINEIEYNLYKFPGSICCYSFQNPDEQIFSTTVANEVTPKGMGKTDNYINLVLEAFGLQHIKDHHPLDMPFTIRKRITLAATVASNKSWYIFDEPTLGQDEAFTNFFVGLINQLTRAGKGIILISHSSEFIKKIMHETLYLENGNINMH